MYAYFKVTVTIGVGVNFYHGLAHLLGVGVQTLHGVLEQLRQLFHADRIMLCTTLDHVLQLRFPHTQPEHFLLQFRIVNALEDRLGAVVQLEDDVRQFLPFCFQISCSTVDLVGNLLCHLRKIHVCKVVLQILHHECLQFLRIDVLGMAGVVPVLVAAAVVPCGIAPLVGGRMPHIAGTALCTLDQTGEQIVPLCLVARPLFLVIHTHLNRLPCVLVDDCRNAVLDADGVLVGDISGILAHDLVVILAPAVHADVPLVPQQIVQAVLAHDLATPSPYFADGVQNLTVAFAGGVHLVYCPDDLRLCRLDHISAVLVNGVAEVGCTAQKLSGLCLGGNAVHGLLAAGEDVMLSQSYGNEFCQIVGRVENVADVILYGNDLNVQQSHLFPETEPVGNVTAATADVVDHNGIEFPLCSVPAEGLERRSLGVGAAHCLVGVAGGYGDAVGIAVLLNFPHLIGNAAVGLMLCAVSCICCCLHDIFSSLYLQFQRKYAIIDLVVEWLLSQ